MLDVPSWDRCATVSHKLSQGVAKWRRKDGPFLKHSQSLKSSIGDLYPPNPSTQSLPPLCPLRVLQIHCLQYDNIQTLKLNFHKDPAVLMVKSFFWKLMTLKSRLSINRLSQKRMTITATCEREVTRANVYLLSRARLLSFAPSVCSANNHTSCIASTSVYLYRCILCTRNVYFLIRIFLLPCLI